MKIEVEIDDNIYRTWREAFGLELDLSGILASIIKDTVILAATYPEEFIMAFGQKAADGLPDHVRAAYEKLCEKHVKKNEPGEEGQPGGTEYERGI